jgi:hypothetical protein
VFIGAVVPTAVLTLATVPAAPRHATRRAHLGLAVGYATAQGWPMRKDYITPDFYELQDAY